MKATTTIPYITLPDLWEVLNTCNDAGYIATDSMQHIVSRVTERTQELIRKSKEATAANLMRDRCRHEARNLHHEQKSHISRQRAMQFQLYGNLMKSSESEHLENIALIKSNYRRLQSQCQTKVDEIRIRIAGLPDGSEERQKEVAAVRVLEGHQRELKRQKENHFADECSRHRMRCDDLRAAHFKRQEQLSAEAKQHLLQYNEHLDAIREAKPEQLAAIYDDLHGQVLAMAREGGES